MASVFKRGGKRANGYWYASWFDHNGKRRTKCTRTTDKATADRIARKHEADAALRRDGVIDPTLDAVCKESQRTIESHLLDYEAKLRAAQRTDEHVDRTIGFVRTISKWAGFTIASDIAADAVNRYAGKLRDEGWSARTIQSHLTGIKGFTKWLTENHKLPRDPLSSIKKPNPKVDRRHERRMLLPEEWRRLEATTEAGPERFGMTGGERALLYRTAIQTGLRSNELRSLTRGRLVLTAHPPHVVGKADSTKNRKDARQYIQPELASQLREHIKHKAPSAPVFGLPHETNMAAMLRADLAAARNAWLKEATENPDEFARRSESDFLAHINHDGGLVDFHSLRHTCGAWLAMAGVHPKVVQTVMRHSTIVLTMDTYGHLFPGQEADAVERLRQMLADPPEALKATGTEDAARQDCAQRRAQQSGSEMVRNRNPDAIACDKPHGRNALRIAELGDDVRRNAIGGDKPRKLTHNPLVGGSNPSGPISHCVVGRGIMASKSATTSELGESSSSTAIRIGSSDDAATRSTSHPARCVCAALCDGSVSRSGECTRGLQLAGETQPDVVVLDRTLAGGGSLELMGHTNVEIAEQLHLSPKTVSTYRTRIAEKLGLRSTADFVRYATDTGLLEN